MVRLRDGVNRDQVKQLLARFLSAAPRVQSFHIDADASVREERTATAADICFTVLFPDAAAVNAYLASAAHGAFVADELAPLCEQVLSTQRCVGMPLERSR